MRTGLEVEMCVYTVPLDDEYRMVAAPVIAILNEEEEEAEETEMEEEEERGGEEEEGGALRRRVKLHQFIKEASLRRWLQ